jgi:hypothetical protein
MLQRLNRQTPLRRRRTMVTAMCAVNLVLTPKIGTEKRLTCGLNLVEKHHSAEGFPQSIQ